VFLVLGGGGTHGPANVYGTDTATDLPQAKVISERNAITGSQATGFTRNAADSIEDAPWPAATNAGDACGYATFDVDPGRQPGWLSAWRWAALAPATWSATPDAQPCPHPRLPPPELPAPRW
jgi:hypothetical protein